jgi:hypothetical protein
MGILQEKTVHEAAMNIDVNILVDGGRDEKPAMFPIVGREISPAAAEGDSQGRARDDHSGIARVKKLTQLVQRISKIPNAERGKMRGLRPGEI